VNQTGGGEIGELAQSFNLMTQALARQEQWRHTAAADLAHELRTPLATIQARVEAIEDGVLPASPENLRVIGEEVERLGRLLSTLRRLDELDTGETRLNREPLNLRAFLTDVTDASRAAFTQAGLELRCDAEPVVLSADPDQLRQVLLNLLDNARKFTPSGGRVEIRAVSDDRSASRQGGRVLISVVDSGPGIPPEERGLVFDRFYRAHGAEGTEGAGLGLAIAKRIVEAHGGTIELATPAGGGTAVTISLPLDGLASGMTPRKSAKR
jgi:signal transduction histidine kinase